MLLKKLEIVGFKSFLEKTTVQFPPGISAIVGPNGCGKSNIVDAMRWVMGEQSVKQLRGKSMEDIIFAGTNGKAPLNMAEVSLTVLNNNGSVPEALKDYHEIMITRRLYRSGESTYLINKQPCRLKDIHHLFMGSGMGAKTYAIIQQGNVGAITDASPEERRFYIEAAAGVTRYKDRKNEALRKVFTTNQNLLRVADIISEVKRRMNSLKRQAKTAERYRHYQDRVRRLDIIRSLQRYDAFQERLAEIESLLTGHRDAEMQQSMQIGKLGAAVEAIKLERWKKDQAISEHQSRKFDLQRQVDRLENDLDHLRRETERLGSEADALAGSRRDIEAKIASMDEEIKQMEAQQTALSDKIQSGQQRLDQEKTAADQLKSTLSGLEQTLEAHKARLTENIGQEARFRNIYQNAVQNKENIERRLKKASEEEHLAQQKMEQSAGEERRCRQRLDGIRDELQVLAERIAELQKHRDEKNTALGRQVKSVQSLELERNKVQSKYQTLKKMEQNFEWYKEGVRAVMRRYTAVDTRPGEAGDPPAPQAVLGLMADMIEPAAAYTTAVEAVLGETLQYVLVADAATGVDCIRYLQSSRAGRSGFIPLPALKPPAGSGPAPPPEATPLLSHVSVKHGFEKAAQALLGSVWVTETLDQALAIYNQNGHQNMMVTRDGDIVSPRGLLIGGSQQQLAGILAKKQELKTLEGRMSRLTKDLQDARQNQKSLENEIWELESTLQKQSTEKNERVQNEIAAEKALYKCSEALKHARRHCDIVALEQEQLMEEQSDTENDLQRNAGRLQEIEKEVAAAQAEVTRSKARITALAADLESVHQRLMEVKLSQTELKAKQENGRNSLGRLREYYSESLRRIEQINAEIDQKKQKQVQSRQKMTEDDIRLKQMYTTLESLEVQLESHQSDYQSIDARLKENDQKISAVKTEHELTLKNIRSLEGEQSEKRIKQENIAQQLEERYSLSISDLNTRRQSILAAEEALADMDAEEIDAQLAEYRLKMEKIGDVNLGAIKEYEELEERYEFLSGQHDDLVKALDDLNKVIRKINKISQQRFVETFNEINSKLDEVFPRLFEGGSAKLVLTEPNQPLESGVEFMIHPPGKKLTRMSLLSGGEKALSAIALIFSIFLIKPTSFCLMDEIDAPLDEANVFRFNELLKIIGEKSQIIMVTHNKKSMEFADRLFGITMETKGISKIVSVNLNNLQAAA